MGDQMKSDLDCTWTWTDGCGAAHAPAPFSPKSTLFEICPRQCEAHPHQSHPEEPSHDPRFKAIGGDDAEHEHRVCRHAHENDTEAHYYILETDPHMTLRTCKDKCIKRSGCKGIEYKTFWWHSARCEVWLKPILSTSHFSSDGAHAHGFTCLSYDPDAEVTDGHDEANSGHGHGTSHTGQHTPAPSPADKNVPVKAKTVAIGCF